MPSTRKQKAKEKRSRQLAIMFDVENVDIMLSSYSRGEDRKIKAKMNYIQTQGQADLNKVQIL